MKDEMRLVPTALSDEMEEACDEPFHAEWKRQRTMNVRRGHDANAGLASGPFSQAVWKAALAAAPSFPLPSREEVARIIEPEAWATLATGPRARSFTYPEYIRDVALAKADSILNLLRGK